MSRSILSLLQLFPLVTLTGQHFAQFFDERWDATIASAMIPVVGHRDVRWDAMIASAMIPGWDHVCP
jgi:hypothetical protein